MEVCAIDAGGTWIKAARVSDKGEILARIKIPSGAATGIDAYFASIATAVQNCNVADAPIGLSIPGMLSADRQHLRYAPNIKGLGVGDGGIRISEEVTQHLGQRQIVAENDAKCAALGEWGQGIGRSDPQVRLLHLTWGTGIGTGFVAEGQTHYGWEGGHIPIGMAHPAVIACGCTSRVDVEAYAAVPHLIAVAKGRWEKNPDKTTLTAQDFSDPFTASKILVAKAQAGDSVCQQVIDEGAQAIARGLLAMAVLAYPTVVTIGGGIMSSDWLLERLRDQVARVGHGIAKAALPPTIVQRAQLGNDAGMIGAAILALKTFHTVS